jgi:nicotinate-nucleotide pyrophosphorylase
MKLNTQVMPTLKNIKKISNTGINRISVGAITHSAKSFDTSSDY